MPLFGRKDDERPAPKGGKSYSGRLAFDPETGFHVDPDGQKVVSDDYGQTWRYATGSDTSHLDRYESRVVVVDATNRSPNPDPHHYKVQPDDAHLGGPILLPDEVAAVQTSHTDAPHV